MKATGDRDAAQQTVTDGANGDHRLVVAIDGPAAAGKTTVAHALAARLGAIFLDTGLLYRAVTLAGQRAGIAPSNGPALAEIAESLPLTMRPSTTAGRLLDVLLAGEDVTVALRTPAIDANVSEVAAHPAVRQALLPLQRRIADGGRVIMVGRDIATVVVPDAGVKIYLDASAEERARRRHHELDARGVEISEAEVLSDVIARDAKDSSRETSPLRQAADAIVVPTDGLTIEQVVDLLVPQVQAVWDRVAGERSS